MFRIKTKMFALTAALAVISSVSCSSSVANNKPADADSSSAESTITSSGDVVITMADLGKLSGALSSGKKAEMLKAFNDADNGYQIVLKDYSEYYNGEFDENGCVTEEGMAGISDQLALDIVKGNVIDIVPIEAFADTGKFFSLLDKGAFADLMPYIEQDADVNASELDGHILDICKTNGKLSYLPLGYSIDTMTGFTKYVGDKENWTMDELIDRWKKMPEGSTFNGHNTKDNVYYDLIRNSLSSFIDLESATCRFDSDEFLKVLNFCNSFDSPHGYKENPDWNSPQFLSQCSIYGFNNYHEQLWNEQNEPLTFVGYPSEDGSGSFINITDAYALSAFSAPEVQKGAWEFIKMFADEDYQYFQMQPEDTEESFPVNRNAFDKKANEALANAGKENTITINDFEYEIGFFNNDEYERLIKYIDSIDRVGFDIEDDVYNIINDEILKMVFEDASPNEVSSNIQNRASILISEKNG